MSGPEQESLEHIFDEDAATVLRHVRQLALALASAAISLANRAAAKTSTTSAVASAIGSNHAKHCLAQLVVQAAAVAKASSGSIPW
jgi:hypothetical protein